jgi:hypothetical protein
MRRFLGYIALAIAGAVVMAASDVARTSSLTNRYDSNYDATWTALNKLSFSDQQLAFIKGLSAAQCTFLANVKQIGVPLDYPLAGDGHSGASWASGERDYINAIVDLVNDLVNKMQTQHIMSS